MIQYEHGKFTKSHTRVNANTNACGSPCIGGHCRTCEHTEWSDKFTANTTGKLITKPCTLNINNCHDTNVIYLITCKRCNLQYVGQTKRTYRQRMMEHNRSIKRNNLNTLLVKHFNSDDHSIQDFSSTILQKVNNTDALLDCEKFWTLIINSAHPYGLNDRVEGYGFATINGNNAKRKIPYFQEKVTRYHRSHGARKNKPKKSMSNDELDDVLSLTTDNQRSVLYKTLRGMNRKSLKQLHRRIDNANYLNPDEKALFTDYINVHAPTKPMLKKPTKRGPIIKIDFANKGIDLINPSTILKDKRIITQFPLNKQEEIRNARVVYQYEHQAGLTICNHNKITKDLTKKDLETIYTKQCLCVTQNTALKRYIDPSKGHILTGDLSIIKKQSTTQYSRKWPTTQTPQTNKHERSTGSSGT